jgi:hypothetical protein
MFNNPLVFLVFMWVGLSLAKLLASTLLIVLGEGHLDPWLRMIAGVLLFLFFLGASWITSPDVAGIP